MPILRAVAAAIATTFAVASLGPALPAAGIPTTVPAVATSAATGTTTATATTAKTTAAAPTAAATTAATTAAATTAVPGGFHALPAHRLLDTRSGLGAPKAAVAAGSSITVQVAGREGVPATGVGAVALSITVLGPTGAGAVSAYPAGSTLATPYSVYYAAGDVVANLVVTRLSSDGRVEVRVSGSGSTQLVADVVGWVETGEATEPGAYVPVDPARILDTRNGTGAPQAPLAGGATLTVPVADRGGVPASGAGSVLLNLTAANGTASGTLTVGPTLTGPVATSSLGYAAGQTRANLVAVPLSDAGTVDLRVTSTGSVNAFAEVVGWVRAGTPVGEGTLAGVAPTRLLDTRTDWDGSLTNLTRAKVHATGVAGVPASGVHAALLNVTSVDATAQGRVSVLPTASNLPSGSQMQFTKGRNDANFVVAPVSPTGDVDLMVQTSGSVHLLVDVVGYVVGAPVDTVAPGQVTYPSTSHTKTSISLSWSNPTDVDLTGVTVRRYAGGAGVGNPFLGQVVAETTGTTFTDTNLSPGTSYGYSVWAHDGFPNIADPYTTVVTTTAPVWGTPARVAPLVGSPSTVSCVTTSWCMAGDESGQYLTWNGSAWSAPKRAFLIGDPDDGQDFRSLACPATTFCAAAAGRGGLVTYRDGAWGAVSYPKPTTGGVVQYWNVDCVSASFCLAVARDASNASWATRWNGTTWSTPAKVASWLHGIDCVSTTFCMAVGDDSSGGSWATRWNGSTWTAKRIDSSSAYGGWDVSCTSASFCMAAGSTGHYVRWNGTAWTAPASSPSIENFRVSCTSPTFCLSVDGTTGSARWNGSSWTRATRPGYPSHGPADLACVSTTCVVVDALGRFQRYSASSWSALVLFAPTRGGMSDLSCPSVTSCLATDLRGEAYRWNGSAWSAPVTISWGEGLVSCATTTWCLTVAPRQNVYRVFDGSTWTALAAAPARLAELECPAVKWCVGFDWYGKYSVFSGTSWSALKALHPGAGRTSVDCVSKTFCMSVSTDGNRWSRWNGTSWSTPTVLYAKAPWGGVVSCASTTMCVSADWDGNSFLFNGTSWRTFALRSVSTYGAIDISCPSATMCRVLDSWGRVGVFTGSVWKSDQEDTGLYMEDGRPTDYPSSIECPDAFTCVVVGRSKAVVLR